MKRHASRRKQPYLVNPRNPMVSLHPHIKVWRDPISGKFGGSKKGDKKSKGYKLKFKSIMARRAIEKDLLHHATHIPSSYVAPKVAKRIASLSKKHRKGHKLHGAAKAAFLARLAKGRAAAARKRGGKAMKGLTKRILSARRRVAKKAVSKIVHRKTHRKSRSIKMAKRRKSHSRKSHRNPFSPAGIMGTAKGLFSADLLIDGGLVAVGMIASKYAVDFASGKVAFLATPYGRIGSRVVLGMGALASGKYIGKRYAEPIALGFIAPAILDVVEMVLPALLPAGGVKLLESGYMPDVQSQVSLEQGYMPDVSSTLSGGQAGNEFE